MIKKILLVDDHVSFLAGFSKALKRYCDYNGEITAVENGERAINEVSSSLYDICFLDINLPDINGLDVMKRIHDITPSTKVVIMSAEVINENMKRKIDERASFFIPKPVELDTVKDYINKELEKIEDFNGQTNNKGNNYTENRRLLARRSCSMPVRCSVSIFHNWEVMSSLEVSTVDISDGGVGVESSFPLYPGNVIKFNNILENKSGIVKWTLGGLDKNYRVGIKFI